MVGVGIKPETFFLVPSTLPSLDPPTSSLSTAMANSRYVSLAELTSMVYISCTLLASCPATPPCSPRDVNVSASALSFSQAVSMSSSTKTFSGVFLDLAMPVAWLAMVAKFPFNTRAKAAAQSRSSMKIFLAKLRSDTTWASVYSRYWIQTLAWTCG